MKIQNFYKWYCITTWSLWLLFITLSILSEELLNGDQVLLSAFTFFLFLPSIFVAVVPAQPILFGISFAFSIKNQSTKYIIFDALSLLISAILVVGVFFIYLVCWAPSH